MKVYEIAKELGIEAAEVAADLAIEAVKGYHFSEVEQGQADRYMELKRSQATEEEAPEVVAPVEVVDEPEKEEQAPMERVPVVPKTIRFWSASKSYLIPAGQGHGKIQFANWAFEGLEDSAEVKYLRDHRDYFIAQHTYEVIPKKHDDPMMIADFSTAMTGSIYTGMPGDLTMSRTGRNSVLAILPTSVVEGLGSVQKSNIKMLTRTVAERVSLNVTEYGKEL